METLSANEAKIHFGELLLKAQHEPIQINRNGRGVAVVLSMHDYKSLETLKMQQLKSLIEKAKKDLSDGNISDGDSFFAALLDGEFD